MQNVIWTPPAEVVDRARVTAFMREQGIAGWRDLGRRAQDDIGWFWDAVVTHLGLEFTTPYTRVYDDSDGPMWTRWFGGGRINLTHNCVDRHARDNPERTAVIWESEDGQGRTVSRVEAEVNRINALRLGVSEPDGGLPMSVEVVAGFYAIWAARSLPIFGWRRPWRHGCGTRGGG
jgi:acetyl-CoA synthetase